MANAKLPPARLVRVVEGLRNRLQKLDQRMVPAQVSVLEMASAYRLSQALYAAAKLGIADVLADGPLTAEQIARKVGSNPDATYRLLRALASRSVFAELPDGRFTLTPTADTLRDDAPESMRRVVLFFGHKVLYGNWGHLDYSVESGLPAQDKVHGLPGFEYLDTNPEFAGLFNDAMTTLSQMAVPPILAAYDFSSFGTIVDVGGGHGALLGAILARTPTSRGVLFDFESVVAAAEPALAQAGVADRCTTVSGSFFESVPSSGDAYLLKHIIHDWSDDMALKILRNVRAAMKPDGKLILLEMVVPKGNSPHEAKWLDLEMLVNMTGRERTADQFTELLADAGFTLTRIVATVAPICVVEAKPTS